MNDMLFRYTNKSAQNGCIIARHFSKRTSMSDAFSNIVNTMDRISSFNIRQFIVKNQFCVEITTHRYRRDKLDPKEWCIVYYEPHCILLNNFYRLTILFILFILIKMAKNYDYQSGRFTDPRFVRAHNAIIKLGIVGYILLPPFAVITMINILRIPNVKLSRIYLNRQNPEELLLVTNRLIFFNKWTKMNRKDVIHFESERQYQQTAISLLKSLYGANTRFGGLGRYSLSSRGFRTNTFQTFLLNQTNNIPKLLLDKMDLESDLKK